MLDGESVAQRAGPSAIKAGLVVGSAGAIFALTLDSLIVVVRQAPSQGLACGGCVAFLAILALCVEAGNVAVAGSGRVSDGTIAGLIAGGLAGIGLGLLSPVLEIVNGRIVRAPIGVVIVGIIVIALAACMMAGLGAALGALGGLIGQSRYAKAKRSSSAADTVSGQR